MDRHQTAPFMLQLFYRTNAFHRPDEFTATPLPPHLTLHTWPNCTLTELSHHLAASDASILPSPAIGTRLAFRLIFPDTRGGRGSSSSGHNHHHHHHHHRHHHAAPLATPRYMVKELGSIVIGDGGPGLGADDADVARTLDDDNNDDDHSNTNAHDYSNHDTLFNNNNHNNSNGDSSHHRGRDADKTLADARFVVGDYISCAILPPQPDGAVAPASSARMGRGAGAGESRVAVGRAPGLGGAGGGMGMGMGMGSARDRENGYGGYGHGRHGRGTRSGGGGGRGSGGGGSGVGAAGAGAGGGGGGGGDGSGVPMGEWRRGERLPDIPPPGRGRPGRGRY